jgi:hypothetical protein
MGMAGHDARVHVVDDGCARACEQAPRDDETVGCGVFG